MILSCGDALIDMVPVRTSDGRGAYVPRVGGSCLNVAVAMARLGTTCGFVGGISSDFFGDMIRNHLLSAGVDLSFVSKTDLETTLAFVALDGKDARYVFYDTATAARSWVYEADCIDLKNVDCLHLGSVTLIGQPSASSFETLAYVGHQSCTVSFDPNCRPSLVGDHASYRGRMNAIARGSDIVRYSDEDFSYLYPNETEEDVSGQLLTGDTSLVIITRGAAGATVFTKDGQVHHPAPHVQLVDTIGAGDTFQAAFLSGLSENGLLSRARLRSVTVGKVAPILDFALLAASKSCEREGANPPFRHELFLAGVEVTAQV